MNFKDKLILGFKRKKAKKRAIDHLETSMWMWQHRSEYKDNLRRWHIIGTEWVEDKLKILVEFQFDSEVVWDPPKLIRNEFFYDMDGVIIPDKEETLSFEF